MKPKIANIEGNTLATKNLIKHIQNKDTAKIQAQIKRGSIKYK